MSREPLTREAIIAGAIGLGVQLLLMLGVSEQWATWAGAACTLAVAAWIVLRVRPKVTPVADPRDDQGRALTP
jgi:uncharacterized membrane protein YjjB (DUF3815 family)